MIGSKEFKNKQCGNSEVTHTLIFSGQNISVIAEHKALPDLSRALLLPNVTVVFMAVM